MHPATGGGEGGGGIITNCGLYIYIYTSIYIYFYYIYIYIYYNYIIFVSYIYSCFIYSILYIYTYMHMDAFEFSRESPWNVLKPSGHPSYGFVCIIFSVDGFCTASVATGAPGNDTKNHSN